MPQCRCLGVYGRMIEPIRFFLPGPAYVPEAVRQAMTRPVVGHRSASFRELYASLGPRLSRVFRSDREVWIGTSSATLMMEAAVVSTVSRRVLSLTCGAFSERWHTIAGLLGKDADRVSVPWGEAIDPDLVRRALRRERYEAVTVAHSETSTGVLNPVDEIARAVREESDALLLVDAVSSLGGAELETERWEIDVVLTGSQKALAVPPGLSLVSLSERAIDRAARVPHRGFYTDLLRYRDQHAKGGTITTPAVSLVYALDRQLDRILEEGMEARWQRHLGLQQQVREWAASRGFRVLAPEAHRSPTLTCLEPPSGLQPAVLLAKLAAAGFVVGSGYGDFKPTTFRIGHMGEVRESDIAALLGAIDEALDEVSAGRRSPVTGVS